MGSKSRGRGFVPATKEFVMEPGRHEWDGAFRFEVRIGAGEVRSGLGADDAVALDDLLRALVDGDRPLARACTDRAVARGGARDAIERLLWPACASLHALARADRLAGVAEHCATVLLSQLVQRAEDRLARPTVRLGRVVATSGPAPFEEIAGEAFAALAESAGFEVVFLAGGVESDDLLAEIGRRQPGFLVSFGAAGADAPRLRRVLEALRIQQPVPGLLVGVGGGVFGRAPGLAEEIGAHFEGASPSELVEAMLALRNPGRGGSAGRRAA